MKKFRAVFCAVAAVVGALLMLSACQNGDKDDVEETTVVEAESQTLFYVSADMITYLDIEAKNLSGENLQFVLSEKTVEYNGAKVMLYEIMASTVSKELPVASGIRLDFSRRKGYEDLAGNLLFVCGTVGNGIVKLSDGKVLKAGIGGQMQTSQFDASLLDRKIQGLNTTYGLNVVVFNEDGTMTLGNPLL